MISLPMMKTEVKLTILAKPMIMAAVRIGLEMKLQLCSTLLDPTTKSSSKPRQPTRKCTLNFFFLLYHGLTRTNLVQQYFNRLVSKYKAWTADQGSTGQSAKSFPFAREIYQLLKDDPSVFPVKTLESFEDFTAGQRKKRAADTAATIGETLGLTNESDSETANEDTNPAPKKRLKAAAVQAQAFGDMLDYFKESEKNKQTHQGGNATG